MSCCKDDISLRDDDCDECDISLDIFDGTEYEGVVSVVCSNKSSPMCEINTVVKLFNVVDSTYILTLLFNNDSVYNDREFQFDIECITLECMERHIQFIHGDSLVAGNISASSNDLYFTFLASHCDDYISFSGDKNNTNISLKTFTLALL